MPRDLASDEVLLSIDDLDFSQLVDIANNQSKVIDKYWDDQGNISQMQHDTWKHNFDVLCNAISRRIELAGQLDITFFVNIPERY